MQGDLDDPWHDWGSKGESSPEKESIYQTVESESADGYEWRHTGSPPGSHRAQSPAQPTVGTPCAAGTRCKMYGRDHMVTTRRHLCGGYCNQPMHTFCGNPLSSDEGFGTASRHCGRSACSKLHKQQPSPVQAESPGFHTSQQSPFNASDGPVGNVQVADDGGSDAGLPSQPPSEPPSQDSAPLTDAAQIRAYVHEFPVVGEKGVINAPGKRTARKHWETLMRAELVLRKYPGIKSTTLKSNALMRGTSFKQLLELARDAATKAGDPCGVHKASPTEDLPGAPQKTVHCKIRLAYVIEDCEAQLEQREVTPFVGISTYPSHVCETKLLNPSNKTLK